MKPVIKKISRFFSASKKRITTGYQKTKTWLTPRSKRVVRYVDTHPMKSFYIALGVLLALIVLSNIIFRPKVDKVDTHIPTKTVQAYSIGQAPTMRVQAQVRKSGVIQIVALTSGIVSDIYFTEGAQVPKGTTLLAMSSNYSGGNAASIQRQIAQQQYENVASTYDQQVDLIHKNRDIANNTELNLDEQRSIASQSASDTERAIHNNVDAVTLLQQQLDTLMADPVGNATLITAARQQIGQLQSALTGASTQLRTLQNQANANGPQAQNARLQREAANKQLDIQEKQLGIQKEIFRLQVSLAQVNEAAMYPSAPFAATIQHVHVTPNESVSPGTPLMTIAISEGKDPVTAVAYVSKEVARQVSRTQEAKIYIDDTHSFTSTPSFVSTEAVQGSLYGVYFPIPDDKAKQFTNKGYAAVDLPVGYADTNSVIPFVPIDAVYQTRDSGYVFIESKGKAKSKKIQLGNVFGQSVEVTSGLKNGDRIILNRNIIEGDPVKIQ